MAAKIKKLADYEPTRFMLPTSHYEKRAADQAVAFIEDLRHPSGSFEKFLLIEWQERIIRDIFGTLKPNGCRQFKTAYIEIPKKNGKSELAAAVSLLLLCWDYEQRAEIYGCAADRGQASLVFNVAKDIVAIHPVLSRTIKIKESQMKMVFPLRNSFYKVLSAEAYTKHGLNVQGCIFDELHAQPDRRFYDVMTSGASDARDQPLRFIIGVTQMQNIINLLPSILLLAMAIGAVLWGRKKEKDRIDAIGEDIGEEGVAWQRIQQWLRIATFAFVTDAERDYGVLSGLQKQSVVLAKVIDMLPPELRGRIRADVLLDFIEGVLNEAKEQWMENPKLLESAIDSELLECEPLRLIAAKDIKAGDAVEICTAFAPVEDEGGTGCELGEGGTHAEGGTPCGTDAVGQPGDPGDLPKKAPRKKTGKAATSEDVPAAE